MFSVRDELLQHAPRSVRDAVAAKETLCWCVSFFLALFAGGLGLFAELLYLQSWPAEGAFGQGGVDGVPPLTPGRRVGLSRGGDGEGDGGRESETKGEGEGEARGGRGRE